MGRSMVPLVIERVWRDSGRLEKSVVELDVEEQGRREKKARDPRIQLVSTLSTA